MNSESSVQLRPQISLKLFLMVIATIAIGLSWYQARLEVQRLRVEAGEMKQLARELDISDDSNIAVISALPQFSYDYRYNVWIPARSEVEPEFELCFAVEGITYDYDGYDSWPEALETVPISAGEHVVSIKDERFGNINNPEWKILVTLDGKVVMETVRPPDWHTAFSWDGSSTYQVTQEFSPDQPAEVYRHRFKQLDGNRREIRETMTPANGVLVWIRRAQINAR